MLLWKLADSLNSGKWIIAGHSMGASIAGAIAAMYPDKIKYLILVDGTFGGTEKSDKIGFTNWLISSVPIKRLAEVIGRHYFYNHKKFKKIACVSVFARARFYFGRRIYATFPTKTNSNCYI